MRPFLGEADFTSFVQWSLEPAAQSSQWPSAHRREMPNFKFSLMPVRARPGDSEAPQRALARRARLVAFDSNRRPLHATDTGNAP